MRASSLRMAQKSLLIDVHTHIYTPRLVETLRNRTSNPRIHTSQGNEFLAILPTEHKGGRPIGSQYWSRSERLSFMDRHRIDISLVSLANPWLDFFSPSEAIQAAKEVNEDLEKFCFDPSQVQNQGEIGSPASVFSAGDARSNFNSPISNSSRIRAFGSLPFAPGVPVEELVSSLESISKSKLLSGTILGSRGLGKGLDDPRLEPFWETAERLGQVLFLHPHYGTGQESSNEDGLWGTADNGHVLQLALGFPFETTSAATRLILAGVFDRYPNLKILLAHSGAALPLLSSRLASCVIHDPTVQSRLKHDPRYYLGKFYYDATCYGSEELEFVSKIIGRSQRFKRGGQGLHGTPQIGSEEEKIEKEFGGKRIMFGTDFPFFPPVGKEVEESSQEQPMWMSVTENLNAIRNVRSWGKEDRDRVMFRNAVDLFELEPEYE